MPNDQEQKRKYGYQTADLSVKESAMFKARQMRANPTKAEELLWQMLRNRKTGYKFRRQHPIDIFIVDFVCLEKKIVVEVDGNIHQEKDVSQYDEIRTDILNQLGFNVIRFSNEEIITNPADVVIQIKNTLKS